MRKHKSGLPRVAAALFCLLVAISSLAVFVPGATQALAQQATPQDASLRVPDSGSTVRLILSTLMALEHANKTGNFSVFHQLGAPGLQKANTPQRLAQAFANLRGQNVNLAEALMVAPVFTQAPAINKDGFLHLKGHFPLRPQQVRFEFLFQPVNTQWRLFGISVSTAAAPPLQATLPANNNNAKQNAGTPQPVAHSQSRSMPGFLSATGLNPWLVLSLIASFLLILLALAVYIFTRRRKRVNLEEPREYYDRYDSPLPPRMPPPR